MVEKKNNWFAYSGNFYDGTRCSHCDVSGAGKMGSRNFFKLFYNEHAMKHDVAKRFDESTLASNAAVKASLDWHRDTVVFVDGHDLLFFRDPAALHETVNHDIPSRPSQEKSETGVRDDEDMNEMVPAGDGPSSKQEDVDENQAWFITVPGRGICKEVGGEHGQARYYLNRTTSSRAEDVCRADRRCVAFVYAPDLMMAIIHSSSSLCTNDCGKKHWLANTKLIAKADSGGHDDWRLGICKVKQVQRPEIMAAGEWNCHPYTCNPGFCLGQRHVYTLAKGRQVAGENLCQELRRHNGGTFPFANGGMWWGRAGAFEEFHESLWHALASESNNNAADQGLRQLVQLKYPSLRIEVDIEQQYVYTGAGSNTTEEFGISLQDLVKTGPNFPMRSVYPTRTGHGHATAGGTPLAMHLNGDSKGDYIEMKEFVKQEINRERGRPFQTSVDATYIDMDDGLKRRSCTF